MSYVSKKYIFSTRLGYDMEARAGYREKDIMFNSNFIVRGNKGRTITFYKKNPDFKKSRFDNTVYHTATFDCKNRVWVG